MLTELCDRDRENSLANFAVQTNTMFQKRVTCFVFQLRIVSYKSVISVIIDSQKVCLTIAALMKIVRSGDFERLRILAELRVFFQRVWTLL